MDISLDIDTAALEKRFTRMAEKIDHFKRNTMGSVMSDWQVEDMHRDKPFTMRWRAQGRAQTVVRPHSLYEMIKSQGVLLPVKQQRRAIKGLRKNQLTYKLRRGFYKSLREHRRWSTRDILRKELIDMLMAREWNALQLNLKWKDCY